MKLVIACGIITVATMAATARAAMPPQEARLLHTLSSYNEAYDRAPNEIQHKQIWKAFGQKFCAEIPRGVVHGWIGDLDTIRPAHHPVGVLIDIDLPFGNLYSGSLGLGLSVGNYLGYGVGADQVIPLGSLVIPAGTTLYNTAINLRSGGYDRVEFSARFDPFISSAACEKAIHYATYFSAVRFLSLRYLGPAPQN